MACPAQHSSAMKQRDLEGTFLTWSACNSTPGTCLSFLTYDTCLWPQCSDGGQKDWTLGCRNNQLLNEATHSLCWSSWVLPPDLKETRNWFWYKMHFPFVQDGSIHRQDLVSTAVYSCDVSEEKPVSELPVFPLHFANTDIYFFLRFLPTKIVMFLCLILNTFNFLHCLLYKSWLRHGWLLLRGHK